MTEGTEIRKHRNIFWAGIFVVLIIVGARIVWVQYSNRTRNHFASRKTDFTLLSEPYQPKWEKTGRLASASNGTSSCGASYTCKSLPLLEEKITQELASNSFGGGLLNDRAWWVATASVESPKPPKHYLTIDMNVEARSKDNCRVDVEPNYSTRTRTATLEISEEHSGQGRKVTLFFKLTPDGFVHIEDEDDE